MKLCELVVGGSQGEHLRLDSLSPGLNVFAGLNGSGKTTLLEGLRRVLYGGGPADTVSAGAVASDSRLSLPEGCKADGTSAGAIAQPGFWQGHVTVESPCGRLRICRMCRPGEPDTVAVSGEAEEALTADVLPSLLQGVDQPTFRQVFAVGWEELQAFGAAEPEEVARRLYLLTGIDRHALDEVLEDLARQRAELMGGPGSASRIPALLERREELLNEIELQGDRVRRYGLLCGAQRQLEDDTARVERELDELQQRQRVLETALTLREKWSQRAALDASLAALGEVRPVPPHAVQRLERIEARIRHWKFRRKERRGELKVVSRALSGLGQADDSPWQAASIRLLLEQASDLPAMEHRIHELQAQVVQAEQQAAAPTKAQVAGAARHDGLPELSPEQYARLRPYAQAVKVTSDRCRVARQAWEEARRHSTADAARLEAAAARCSGQAPAAAADQVKHQVEILRRRVRLDERLDRMETEAQELREQAGQLLDQQLLPIKIVVGLGGAFVLGVALILAGLLFPTSVVGALGWAMAILGGGGVAAVVVGKFYLEWNNQRKSETAQQQLVALQRQIELAQKERAESDQQLPPGSGPLVARLKEAEQELADLQELIQLQNRTRSASQDAGAAQQKFEAAQQKHERAVQRWQGQLQALGLPAEFTLRQAKALVTQPAVPDQAEGRLDALHRELDAARRYRDDLERRVERAWAGLEMTGQRGELAEQLERLASELDQRDRHRRRRRELVVQKRRLRRARRAASRRLHTWRRRRSSLLRRAGAADAQELRRRAEQFTELSRLRERRAELERDIAGCLTERIALETVRSLLDSPDAAHLPDRRDQARMAVGRCEQTLYELYERRGQLDSELQSLVRDRRPMEARFELGLVEQQLREALERWQVLAGVSHFIEVVRKVYEEHRQPQTLREAAHWFARMTHGQCLRIWSRLGQPRLLVTDSCGRTLPAEKLSRGTREQLFLSLRMALVADFARAGCHLPLVLDEVLANFDDRRAEAAAGALVEFAAGHQVLVFTCHEHLAALFAAQGQHVRWLGAVQETKGDAAAPPDERPAVGADLPRENSRPEEVASSEGWAHTADVSHRVDAPHALELPAPTERTINAAAGEAPQAHAARRHHDLSAPLEHPESFLPKACSTPATLSQVAAPQMSRRRHGQAEAELDDMDDPFEQNWDAEEFPGELEDRTF